LCGLQEGEIVPAAEKDLGAVVAPVEGMVNQTIGDGTRLVSHDQKLIGVAITVEEK
jgi:hypothetical protein